MGLQKLLRSSRALLTAFTVIAAAPTYAHHAQAPFFDQERTVEVRGTVVRWIFRNPHPVLEVEVHSGDGEKVVWAVQFAPATVLAKRGWTEQTFKPGRRGRGHGASVAGRRHAWPRASQLGTRRRQPDRSLKTLATPVPGRRLTLRPAPYTVIESTLGTESRYANVENRSAAARGDRRASPAGLRSRGSDSGPVLAADSPTSFGIGARPISSGGAARPTSRCTAAEAQFHCELNAQMRPSSTMTTTEYRADRAGAQHSPRLHLCGQRGDELSREPARSRVGGARLQGVRAGAEIAEDERPNARAEARDKMLRELERRREREQRNED